MTTQQNRFFFPRPRLQKIVFQNFLLCLIILTIGASQLTSAEPLGTNASDTGLISEYIGTSFQELIDVIQDRNFAPSTSEQSEEFDAYKSQSLPHYEVSFKSLGGLLKNNLDSVSKRTLKDAYDYYPQGFKKLVHANGICLSGTWDITEDTPYTGYFKKASHGLVIARASVALDGTTKNSSRGFGLAIKLFPTQNSNEKIKTSNLFTVDILSGSHSDRFLDVALTNNPPLVLDVNLLGVFSKIGPAFLAADSSPTYRPISSIAKIGLLENETAAAPIFMRYRPVNETIKNNQSDFRSELSEAMKENGVLKFMIEVSNTTKDRFASSGWTPIGVLTFNKTYLSYSCDRRLHFSHPADDKRSKLPKSSSSVGLPVSGSTNPSEIPQENFKSILAKISDTYWKGNFQVHGLGPLTNCSGDLDVRFFPEVVEDFSQGESTVSYRHHADFTKNKNPICRYIVAELSPVAVGKCEETFPKKYNPAETAMVPFRTIIPSSNGDSAIVSSPSCDNKTHTYSRKNIQLAKATLSDQNRKLELELHLGLLGSTFKLTYQLNKQD